MTTFDTAWIKATDRPSQSNVVHIGVDHGKPGGDLPVRIGWTIEPDGTVAVRWIQ